MSYYSFLRPLLFRLDAEVAHTLAIQALKRNIVPAQPHMPREILKQTLCGLTFENPVGLAPGFDKNAEAITGLQHQGFGFLELGTVTPKPQEGNPKPRIFRLVQDEAVINRLGFNNKGLDVYCRNLADRHQSAHGAARSGRGSEAGGVSPPSKIMPIGANIGKNKDTAEALDDYLPCLEAVAPLADYVTINISSPNTAGLRDLQERSQLEKLLKGLIAKRDSFSKRVPLFLKIAPDLSLDDKKDIAHIAMDLQIDALIISNTTVDRPLSLRSPHRQEKGGLSGKPLFSPSTTALAEIYGYTQGKIPLIGVGGISSGLDAYQKIRAGASLVQLYSALVYQGFDLVTRINRDLAGLLAQDGFTSISDAVGIESR